MKRGYVYTLLIVLGLCAASFFFVLPAKATIYHWLNQLNYNGYGGATAIIQTFTMPDDDYISGLDVHSNIIGDYNITLCKGVGLASGTPASVINCDYGTNSFVATTTCSVTDAIIGTSTHCDLSESKVGYQGEMFYWVITAQSGSPGCYWQDDNIYNEGEMFLYTNGDDKITRFINPAYWSNSPDLKFSVYYDEGITPEYYLPDYLGSTNIVWWYYPRDEMVGDFAIPGEVSEWTNYQLYTSIPNPPDSDTWALFVNIITPDGATGFDYDFIATTTNTTLREINRRSDLENGFYEAYAVLYYGDEDCDQTLNCELTEFVRSEKIKFEITDSPEAKTLIDDDLWEGWTSTTTDEWTTGQPIWDDFIAYGQRIFPLSLYMQFKDEIKKIKHSTTTVAAVTMSDFIPELPGVTLPDTNLISPVLLQTGLGDIWSKIRTLITYILYTFFIITTLYIIFPKFKKNA